MCSTLVRKEERRLRSFCLGDPSARRLVGSLELAVPELGVLPCKAAAGSLELAVPELGVLPCKASAGSLELAVPELGVLPCKASAGSLELAVPELGVLVGDLAHEGRLGPLGTAQLGVGGAKGQGGDESGDFHFAKMNKT